MQDTVYFEDAIILTKSHEHARLEKNILRTLGLKEIAVYINAMPFIKYLRDISRQGDSNLQRRTIIFCHTSLSDMDISELMQLIKLNPYFVHQPFICIVGNETEYLTMSEYNFAKVLMRPLDIDAVEQALKVSFAFEEERRKKLKFLIDTKRVALNTEKFDTKAKEIRVKSVPVKTKEPAADELLIEGNRMLQEGKTAKALALFSKATAESKTAAQAYVLLAKVYRDQSDRSAEEKYLKEAIKSYAQFLNFSKIHETTLLYKNCFPENQHPLTSEIRKYVAWEKMLDIVEIFLCTRDIYPFLEVFDTFIDVCAADRDSMGLAEQFANSLLLKEPVLAKKVVPAVDAKRKKNIQNNVQPVSTENTEISEQNTSESSLSVKETLEQELADAKNDPWLNHRFVAKIDDTPPAGQDADTSTSLVWSVIKNTASLYGKVNKSRGHRA